jgi:hypothetical protein
VTALRGWLAARSARERRLLAAAAAAAAVALAAAAVLGVRDDVRALRARAAARERQLADVRRLAAALRRAPAPPAGDGATLVADVERAADAVVGRGRIAALTPVTDGGGGSGLARATLRVTGASLAETVRLLHALETDAALRVTAARLEKHPDDATRFEATVDVAAVGSAP